MKPRRRVLPAGGALALLAVLAGCAGYDGGNLSPGQSTSAEVEKSMGQPAERRQGANGETVLWFPRLPAGRVSYAARIGKDDRLIAVEQRLTRENFETLKPGVSRASDVRDVLGPPHRIDNFPRHQRDAWSYPAQEVAWMLIIVQLSPDDVVREAYMVNDPATQSMDGPR
jgi:hypothetical protein